MSNMLERNHRQHLQTESGDGRSGYSMEGGKARPQALCDRYGQVD